ncbi:MAG: DUF6249 domain-containing protein [Pseudomonadota bacterium]
MEQLQALKHIMPFMIPLVAIVMGIGIGMLALWIDYRKKREIFELHHRERMLAIERGMEVPPLPDNLFGSEGGSERRRRTTLHTGLVWLLVAVGIAIALAVNVGPGAAAWALIPGAVGLADIIFYLTGKDQTAPPHGA